MPFKKSLVDISHKIPATSSAMQIPLNSREHGETLKAFYSVPPLRLNSWPETPSATIFSSLGITTRRFSRFYVLHTRSTVCPLWASVRAFVWLPDFLTSLREAPADWFMFTRAEREVEFGDRLTCSRSFTVLGNLFALSSQRNFAWCSLNSIKEFLSWLAGLSNGSYLTSGLSHETKHC